jgi:hypothetical protein
MLRNGGQSSKLHLKVAHFFSTPGLIKHLRQLKTFVYLHWCLICAALLAHFLFVYCYAECVLILNVVMLSVAALTY